VGQQSLTCVCVCLCVGVCVCVCVSVCVFSCMQGHWPTGSRNDPAVKWTGQPYAKHPCITSVCLCECVFVWFCVCVCMLVRSCWHVLACVCLCVWQGKVRKRHSCYSTWNSALMEPSQCFVDDFHRKTYSARTDDLHHYFCGHQCSAMRATCKGTMMQSVG
jgi:hypothetical protein